VESAAGAPETAAAQKKEQQSNAQAEAAERTREAARKAVEDAQRRNAEQQRQSAEAAAQKAQQEAETRRREADAARAEAQRAQDDVNREEGAARDRSQAADAAQRNSPKRRAGRAKSRLKHRARRRRPLKRHAGQCCGSKRPARLPAPVRTSPRTASTRNDTSSSKTSTDLNGKDIADLYDVATATEKEIAELDRQIRAANLAAMAKVPYNEALSQTDAAAPLRQPLDRNALSGQSGDAATRRAQTAQAQAQINSMMSSSQRMLARAGGTPGNASGQRSAAQGKDSKGGQASGRSQQTGTGPVAAVGSAIDPARDARMMPLAQQDSGDPKDLTRAMKAMAPGGGGPSDNTRPWLGKAGPEPVGSYQPPQVASEAILKSPFPDGV
jgi:hypothetical protein